MSLEYVSKLMNRNYTKTPTFRKIYVFDQKRNSWFVWDQVDWRECKGGDEPVISHVYFTGTGTRFLEENGKKAVAELFERTFA